MSPRISVVRRWLQAALIEIEKNLRKAVLSGCVALLVAALVWAGDDPWKAKPYQQWDAKDVHKVLDASPWARNVQVAAPWISTGDAGDAASGGVSSQAGPPTIRARQAPQPKLPGRGNFGPGGQTPSVTFLVGRASSRTVREALLR